MSGSRLLQFLGVPDLSPDATHIPDIHQRLVARRDDVGRFDGRFGEALDRSLEQFASQVGLSVTEQRVLGFATLLSLRPCLAKLAAKAFGELEHVGLVNVSARILGASDAAMRTALAPNGTLLRSGLVSTNRNSRVRLHEHFELLPGVVEALCGGEDTIDALLSRWVPVAAPPTLSLRDYPYLRLAAGLTRKTLAAGLRAQTVGVNILLYGPPGSGKSELARVLAAALDVALYAVPCADEQGDPLDGAKRMRGYRLAQNVLAHREDALLLFDEVEDAFPTQLSIHLGNADLTKGWINDALETNPRPTIWVCNGLAGFDEAYVRRFTQVIEVGLPPLPVRKRMIVSQTRRLGISADWCMRAAAHPGLSPALLCQAVRTVASAGYRRVPQREAALDTLLNASLNAMGQGRLPSRTRNDVLDYRPEYLNADQDLLALLRSLQRDPRGRLVLSGPPGTGKTAFGAYVARTLKRPVLLKRASDLLSAFVGGSEQQIAGLFEEASASRAVLLLDEADSFLRDRRFARQAWEVTQVNELLVQLESYDGLFIASTNLFESFDAAALRRFDLKIRFGYLRPEQAWLLFRVTLRQAGQRLTQSQWWQNRLAALDTLTPGTFATVMRRQRLLQQPLTPQRLLDALIAEVSGAETTLARPMGFMANL
ncbi:AAA family ATPase [Thiocapsa imhoffii]|uniref:AAA family ATPase n=2 Tax=Thiocapsa imhoffii TaxID=382777 RepID=A0A9X0WLQ1_9GAMM|nr:AAA family ATPase [Thiocapsa imhoffii]